MAKVLRVTRTIVTKPLTAIKLATTLYTIDIVAAITFVATPIIVSSQGNCTVYPSKITGRCTILEI